jgi:hypothetical protein
MKAFISYSHSDSNTLDLLHKHLATLKRDRLLDAWTDQAIMPGSEIEASISAALASSEIFIAILSPDYLASEYCYEKEFKTAKGLHEQGKIIIVPVIAQPCDWLNTPFREFKALPKDGKAISLWDNQNIAMLDVIQNIRFLITKQPSSLPVPPSQNVFGTALQNTTSQSRNYRVQKDFDSIEKLQFTQRTYNDVKDIFKRYLEEIRNIDKIKTQVLLDTSSEFECIIVNRNKIDTEAALTFSILSDKNVTGFITQAERSLTYSIIQKNRPQNGSFTLRQDEYHLFWTEGNIYFNRHNTSELSALQMAEIIWNKWLEAVGIL